VSWQNRHRIDQWLVSSFGAVAPPTFDFLLLVDNTSFFLLVDNTSMLIIIT
jgi:hypothetical protein